MTRVNEGDSFDLVFELNTSGRDKWGVPTTKGTLNQDVTATLAIDGAGYGSGSFQIEPNQITIPAGTESVTARVTVQDDSVYRYDQINWYVFRISSVSPSLTILPWWQTRDRLANVHTHNGVRIGITDNDDPPPGSHQGFAQPGRSTLSSSMFSINGMQQAGPLGAVSASTTTDTPEPDVTETSEPDVIEITVSIKPNKPPTVANGIDDVTIVNESGTDQVSLSGVFTDADKDDLTITASSSSTSAATVSVAADYSRLTVTAKSRGVATVTVTAADGNGGSVEDSFTVTVKAAPVVSSAISDVGELAVNATHEVSMSGVFSDADGDTITVTNAVSSDNSIATVSTAIDGSTNSVTAVTVTGKGEGTATVTVTAQDSDGNSVSDAFDVTVPAAQQQGVELPGPVGSLELTASGENSVIVRWNAPETGGAPKGYIVHLKPENGEKGSGKTKRPKAKKTQVKFNNLQSGQTYQVWVRAQNETGKGERVHASITLRE